MKWYLGASLHGGLAKTADPHRDPHAETSGRKQWKQGRGRVFQFQRKRSKTSGKRYFQNFSTLCNQQVGGSSPSTGSTTYGKQSSEYGGIPEWPKGADCKSVAFRFGGSNPPSSTTWPQSSLCGHVFYPQDKKHAVRRLSVILFDPHLPSILLFF